jgi:hypothetical protein
VASHGGFALWGFGFGRAIAMAPQTLPCRIPLGQKAAGWMAGKAAPGAA